MALATNTKKTQPDNDKNNAPAIKGLVRRKKKRGGLTLRILAVNLIAPVVLVLGLLYLGQYRASLIEAELGTLKAQAQLFAAAIAEGAVRPVQNDSSVYARTASQQEVLMPDLSRRMVRRLGETTDSRTRLFNQDGSLIGDSNRLLGPGGIVQATALEPPATQDGFGLSISAHISQFLETMPNRKTLPPYPRSISHNANDFPDAKRAFTGDASATAWTDKQGRIILTAAAPVQKVKGITGVVLLTREGEDIEDAMTRVRYDVLTGFLGALSVTILLSVYLAGVIGRPLKRLANAAEAIRQGKGRHIDFPDIGNRRDEIGELSVALQDMTYALWDRMDSIEHFAADVAHELKNPLTSLRSAVETAAKVKGKDREKLMKIIQHDVQRLDRLISDISNASRLDAELSREELGDIDLKAILQRLIDAHSAPMERADKNKAENCRLRLECPENLPNYIVRGSEGRIAQVFENLIGNALSFTPEDEPVILTLKKDGRRVILTIEDNGPGIPENKLESIFERFYTERPKHEDYGSHSGLGLSIAKQIIDAHKGQIYAQNRPDKGAIFTVILDAA